MVERKNSRVQRIKQKIIGRSIPSSVSHQTIPNSFYQILVHTSTKLNFFLGEITVKEGKEAGKRGEKKRKKKKETRFPESIDQAP